LNSETAALAAANGWFPMMLRFFVFLALMAAASVCDAAPIQLLPPGIQQTVVTRAVGSALSKQLPLKLDAGAALPTVDVLPGGPFAGRPLRVTAAMLQQPLPPGDYLIPVTAYCTQYSVHRPGRGVAYKLAPIQGRAANALSALVLRGAIDDVPYAQLQAVQWSIQGGVTYGQMPASYQHTVDALIPEFKGELQEDFVQSVQETYQRVSGTNSNIPPFDVLLAKMGAPGELLLSAKRQREIILSSYRNDQIRNQRLFDGQANVSQAVPAESGPWTVAVPGLAYERFKVIEGWQGRNVLELRIVSQARERAVRRRHRELAYQSVAGTITLLRLFGAAIATGARNAARDVLDTADVATSVAGGVIAYSIGEPTQALIVVPTLDPKKPPCDNPSIQWSFSPDDPDHYHTYHYQSKICSKSSPWCTTETVYRVMLSDAQYIAPMSPFTHQPVRNCGQYNLAGATSPNPIIVGLDDWTHSVTNYTLPDHVFYPGTVRRRVFDDENSVYVDTFGEGTGAERWWNQAMSRGLWPAIDRLLAQRVARGH
jgi:hypothetical protein